MPIFKPPVRSERIPTDQKPFKFYTQPVSMSVVYRNSRFQEVRHPTQEETDALEEGVTWFAGGRTYTVTDATATLLEADGFTTSPDLGPFGGL